MLRLVLWISILAAGGVAAQDAAPKLGPNAVPLLAAREFLQRSPAPDFWRLAAFYLPQETSSACSVASLVMAVNALRGLPPGAEDRLATSAELLDAVGDPAWVGKTVEDGEGVTFADFTAVARATILAYGLEGASFEIFRPSPEDPEALAKLRRLLATNEASESDVVLAYFNQGILTGDWDGPHISPIGAYDAASDRVLVMDVDREWYIPYWSPVPRMLEAMTKPASAEHGTLAGETGGLVRLGR